MTCTPPHDLRIRALVAFIKAEGAEAFVGCLLGNGARGIHYEHGGDYDGKSTDEEVIRLLKTGLSGSQAQPNRQYATVTTARDSRSASTAAKAHSVVVSTTQRSTCCVATQCLALLSLPHSAAQILRRGLAEARHDLSSETGWAQPAFSRRWRDAGHHSRHHSAQERWERLHRYCQDETSSDDAERTGEHGSGIPLHLLVDLLGPFAWLTY